MWDIWNCNVPTEAKQACFDELNDYIEQLRLEPKLEELFIEMTIHCNEHCRHCGSNCGDVKSRNALTDKEILQMLVNLRNDLAACKKKLPFLSITGGEPLMRTGLVELMEKIHFLGYEWGMTSNGLLISKEVAHRLKEAGMSSISISLDGMKKNHEWFRQTEGCFEKTLQAIDNLLEEQFPYTMVTTVLHRQNIGELDDIFQLLQEHNVTLWRITNVDPIGRAAKDDGLMLTPEEYRYMLDFIADKQRNTDMKMVFSCNHYVGLELEGVVRPWLYFCNAGLTVASVQYDGTIGACLDIERREDISYGNVRKDRILEVWNKRFEVFRERKEEKSEKCRGCVHKENCKGGGFHTWDFERNEPRICMPEMLGLPTFT